MATPAFTPRTSGYSTPTGTSGGMNTPLLVGRVLDSTARRRVVVERHFGGRRYRGLHWNYLSDLFHTLVNCPWYRFYLIFVVAYVTMYSLFAAFYVSQPGCITKVSNFWHALWFSVESSATIGYGHQAPDPQCYLLQFGVMAQVLVSLMMQGSLLGLVFARISNSSGRSTTIRFSKVLSMYQGDDGVWRLAFRVANLRQHQVLQPEVRMLTLRRSAVHPFTSAHPEFIYSELKTEHVGGGRLWLGVPSVIEHRVDRGSPLWGMSDADMRAADMEIVVLLDGIDESTSRAIEARHSYVPSDIRWQHHFDPCIQRRRSGKIGVDFSLFDTTQGPPGCAAAAAAAAVGSSSFKFDAAPSHTSTTFSAAANGQGGPQQQAAAGGSVAVPVPAAPQQQQQQQDQPPMMASPFASRSRYAGSSSNMANGHADMV